MISAAKLPVNGKKILLLFHLVESSKNLFVLSCKNRDFLANMKTFAYPFFLATYKLCWSQTFKDCSLCMWILPGTSLVLLPRWQSHLPSKVSCPNLHTFFSVEVPALRMWDQPKDHPINMLQCCPHCPQSSLFFRQAAAVTQQCFNNDVCVFFVASSNFEFLFQLCIHMPHAWH